MGCGEGDDLTAATPVPGAEQTRRLQSPETEPNDSHAARTDEEVGVCERMERDMSNHALVDQFDEEMLRIYQRAQSEARYNASLFLQMLHKHGGLETARILIHKGKVSDGYTALYLRGRLDLTVEAVIHDNPHWHPLFAPEELQICEQRLIDYQYRGIQVST